MLAGWRRRRGPSPSGSPRGRGARTSSRSSRCAAPSTWSSGPTSSTRRTSRASRSAPKSTSGGSAPSAPRGAVRSRDAPRLPNRFSVPGLTTNYATPDGFVTDALCEYLGARARGGFGLIVTENLGVHPGGRVMPRMVMIDDDRYVAGLARLASAVQRGGGVVVGQLSHAWRQTQSRITGLPLVAPSAIPCPINRETPRALAGDEIRELEAAFVSAAVRLAEAGFDGVEIH